MAGWSPQPDWGSKFEKEAAVLPRTPYGFHSTGDDVAAGMDLHGKHVIVTGGSSGIGVETARVLAGLGADVTITARNVPAGERSAAGIRELTGNQRVQASELDLADRRSINRFLKGREGPVDILINNAAVPVTPRLQRMNGWETHFLTNFMGHFALTVGLFEYLAAASAGARVVSVSSGAHLFSPVVFDDINFEFRPYEPMVANGQTKTAAILLAVGVNGQWASAGITANAVNRGLGTSPKGPKTLHQAVATTILAAVSPLLDGVGGRYLDDCNEAPLVDHRTDDLVGVAPYALDPDNAERLWAHATQSL